MPTLNVCIKDIRFSWGQFHILDFENLYPLKAQNSAQEKKKKSNCILVGSSNGKCF